MIIKCELKIKLDRDFYSGNDSLILSIKYKIDNKLFYKSNYFQTSCCLLRKRKEDGDIMFFEDFSLKCLDILKNKELLIEKAKKEIITHIYYENKHKEKINQISDLENCIKNINKEKIKFEFIYKEEVK